MQVVFLDYIILKLKDLLCGLNILPFTQEILKYFFKEAGLKIS